MSGKQDTRERAVSLMESVLRNGSALTPEYPLVFGAAATGDVVALEEEGDVRSACTTLVREFVVGDLRVRGGLIGSVATDPAFRRRGLATRLLLDAEERLAEEGCHFALLWADEPAFYVARGWRPMGLEVDFSIPADKRSSLPRCESVRVAQEGDSGAIHALYTGHANRVNRSPAETELLLASPGVEVLVAESGGSPVGYACMGRGEDLRHVVHEWAGSPEVVLGLVRTHMEREMLRKEPGDVFLMTPVDAQGLHAELERLDCAALEGILGLGKVLDLERTAELLREVGTDAEVGPQAADDDAPGIRIAGPEASVTVPRVELLHLLFAARGDRFHVERVERATGLELPDLPLAPFAWGLDSI